MTIKDIYSYCINELKNNEEKYINTEVLLSHILKKDRLYIKLNLDENIDKAQENDIKSAIEKLKNNMPIHYITKKRDFYGFDFEISENVLIPRNDTEILVEECIKNIKSLTFKNKIKGLEIGVGSGIISISLLKSIQNLEMISTDINEEALILSKKNALNLSVYDRIKLVKSDLYENINEKFDFIVSNPPYIKTSDIPCLSDNIKKYEPLTALDGKKDGLYYYNQILKTSGNYLKEKFFIIFEIGYNQANDIKKLFKKYGFNKDVMIISDYSGYDRVAMYK